MYIYVGYYIIFWPKCGLDKDVLISGIRKCWDEMLLNLSENTIYKLYKNKICFIYKHISIIMFPMF